MDSYHIALFFHVLALIVAAGATAIIKLSLVRRTRARTVGEMLEWHSVLMKISVLFPISLAVFVLSGGYMVGKAHIAWSTGFIVAGLTGVGVLLAAGTVLGVTGKALKLRLEALAAQGANQPAPSLKAPPVISLLPFANTGLVIGVVFDMATKPLSVPTALTVIAIGFGAGAAYGRMAGIAKPLPSGEPAAGD